MLKEIDQMFANHPILEAIYRLMVDMFLAPGEFLLRSLAATPWGHEWGVTVTWPAVALVALFFWCILFNLLLTADASIRRMLNHRINDEPETPDYRQHELDKANGKRIDVR